MRLKYETKDSPDGQFTHVIDTMTGEIMFMSESHVEARFHCATLNLVATRLQLVQLEATIREHTERIRELEGKLRAKREQLELFPTEL